MEPLNPNDNFEQRPHPCIVRDHRERPWGPFDAPAKARAWAQQKWPHIPEIDYHPQQVEFWEIELLNDPDQP